MSKKVPISSQKFGLKSIKIYKKLNLKGCSLQARVDERLGGHSSVMTQGIEIYQNIWTRYIKKIDIIYENILKKYI